ncbi:class GN sortase [Thalassotalea montiporae]
MKPWQRGLVLGSSSLLVLGAVMAMHALWLPTKSWLAHELISISWQHYRETGQSLKPWPWADTTAAAQLSFLRLEEDIVVLNHADATSLAFSAGMIAPFNRVDSESTIAIAGHQDTHFRLLANIKVGDEIKLTTADGQERYYQIFGSDIVEESAMLSIAPSQGGLVLVTCYPFSDLTNLTSLTGDSPLASVEPASKRLIVYALPVYKQPVYQPPVK